MKLETKYIFISLLIFFSLSCGNSNKKHSKNKHFELKRLHTKLPKAKKGEWLYSIKEKGQNFKEYVKFNPIRPNKSKNKIYILPIGEFSDIETFTIHKIADFMHSFFGLEVVIQQNISSKVIPKSAKRMKFNTVQFHTKYILKEILQKNIPHDAIVYTAITSNDLYPQDDWNFVFGQATLKKHVAVSSIFRLKYENLDSTNYQLFLKRITKTITHETCHMFGLRHCKTYECMMNGSMGLNEADSKPLYLCPQCMKKIVWNTQQNSVKRLQNIMLFYNTHNFKKEKDICVKSIKILTR